MNADNIRGRPATDGEYRVITEAGLARLGSTT